uniref:Uncharacterized protein n=1 Tax=Aegilops tauschii subsp. strangulata TaxID=200361 RepID=A0A453H3D1_AEGTS
MDPATHTDRLIASIDPASCSNGSSESCPVPSSSSSSSLYAGPIDREDVGTKQSSRFPLDTPGFVNPSSERAVEVEADSSIIEYDRQLMPSFPRALCGVHARVVCMDPFHPLPAPSLEKCRACTSSSL